LARGQEPTMYTKSLLSPFPSLSFVELSSANGLYSALVLLTLRRYYVNGCSTYNAYALQGATNAALRALLSRRERVGRERPPLVSHTKSDGLERKRLNL